LNIHLLYVELGFIQKANCVLTNVIMENVGVRVKTMNRYFS